MAHTMAGGFVYKHTHTIAFNVSQKRGQQSLPHIGRVISAVE